MTTVLLIGALMLVISIVLSPLSNRIGMPVLLLFLGVGMLMGEDGLGGVPFNDFETAFFVSNLALAVILLDGGMRTRAESFRVGLRPALVLATFGVALTAGITGLVATWIFDLPLLHGLLIGAIVSSTDAAAVFALLQGRGLRLNERVGATLEIESGSNDPMAIFLTLLLLHMIQAQGQDSLLDMGLLLVQQFGIGALCGWLGGRALVAIVNRLQLVPALYPLLVAAGGITVFAGTTALQGSGFLAIYLTGIILGNGKLTALPNILQVHDGLAWLAQMSLFLILGLLVSPSQMLPVALGALAVALAMILVARPLSIILSLWPFGFRWREQAFIAWVGLRGAVPIVLALFPVMAGLPDASLLFNVAFFVVLVSLLLQGTTLAPLARRLKLEVPGDKEPDRRIPLAVPAAGEHELVLYPLQGPRWQEPIRLRQLRLPHGTGVAAIFRNGHYLAPQADLQIGPQDVIALFSTERQLGDLGKLFSGDRIPRHLNERAFFGEFVLSGEALLADLRQAYGVSIDSLPESLSLAECFLRLQHGHPVVGDRLHLGNVQLVVKAMEGDQVTRVGLKLGHDH